MAPTPLTLNLLEKLCYYYVAMDEVRDLRTDVVLTAKPEALGYVWFQTWFEDKVKEVAQRFKDNKYTQDPAAVVAESVVKELFRGWSHAS